MRILEKPDPAMIAKWGPLGHVSDEERQRILDLPSGLFKPAVKQLEKTIAEMKKKAKASKAENTLKALRVMQADKSASPNG
jgi:hypothetical protein